MYKHLILDWKINLLAHSCNSHLNIFLQDGLQALHFAAQNAKVEVIKYLVDTLNVPISATTEVS